MYDLAVMSRWPRGRAGAESYPKSGPEIAGVEFATDGSVDWCNRRCPSMVSAQPAPLSARRATAHRSPVSRSPHNTSGAVQSPLNRRSQRFQMGAFFATLIMCSQVESRT